MERLRPALGASSTPASPTLFAVRFGQLDLVCLSKHSEPTVVAGLEKVGTSTFTRSLWLSSRPLETDNGALVETGNAYQGTGTRHREGKPLLAARES